MTVWLQQHYPDASPPFEAQVEEEGGRITVRLGGEEVILEVEGEETRGWCRWQGRLLPYVFARRGPELHLWLAGHQSVFRRAEGPVRRARTAAGAAAHDVVAPMPGRVLRVLVHPGDAVEAGQPLVVVESMKMEQTLLAPGAGVVRRVLAQEGGLVEGGALLVELRPRE